MKSIFSLFPALALIACLTLLPSPAQGGLDREALKVSAVKKRVGRASSSKLRGISNSVETFRYDIKLENTTWDPIPAMEVEYRIYILKATQVGSLSDVDKPKEITGTAKVEEMARSAKKTIETKPFKLISTRVKSGYKNSNSKAKSRSSDELEGIWVRVLRDGAVISEVSSPASLKEKREW